MSVIPPTNNAALIVDDFIMYATSHLSTVSGVANTISSYPPVGTPGPGIVQWSGYQIQPSRPGGAASVGNLPDTQEVPAEEVEMTPAQEAASEQAMLEGADINEATAAAYEVPVDAPAPSEEEQQQLEARIENAAEEGAAETEKELPSEDKPQNQEVQKPIPNYKTKVKVPDELVLAMRKVGVGKTPLERAHFLAQVAAETGGFRVKTESLMYSASRLLQIFPKYFKSEAQANQYAKNEVKIGSYVYGNRLGNGGESTSEGYKFRGRGMLQVTGKVNYQKFGPMVGQDWVVNPDLVAQMKGGAESACLFWKSNNIAKYATDATTKQINLCGWRVNGVNPPIGAAERIKEFNKYWAELQKDPTLWT